MTPPSGEDGRGVEVASPAAGLLSPVSGSREANTVLVACRARIHLEARIEDFRFRRIEGGEKNVEMRLGLGLKLEVGLGGIEFPRRRQRWTGCCKLTK